MFDYDACAKENTGRIFVDFDDEFYPTEREYAMFTSKALLCDTLCHFIVHAKEIELRIEAWGLFIRQDDSHLHFRYIIMYADNECCDKAAEQLLKQHPEAHDLLCIIEHASDKWKDEARKLLPEYSRDR